MFSNEQEKLEKLLDLETKYVMRINRNVEKLIRQLELFSNIKEQTAGATKSNASSSQSVTPKVDNKKSDTSVTPKADAQKTDTSTTEIKKEQVIEENIEQKSIIEAQIDNAVNEAFLENASKALEGDNVKKLKELQQTIVKLLSNDKKSKMIQEIAKKIEDIKIPEIESLDEDSIEEVKKSVGFYLVDKDQEKLNKSIKEIKEKAAKKEIKEKSDDK